MTTTLSGSGAPARAKDLPASIAESHSKPVYIWAAIGFVCVCVALNTWISWLFSSDFKPSPLGNDPIPNHVFWTLRITEAIAATLAVLLVWKFLIKPWRQTGRITWDGMFVIAGFTCWVLDPMDNYFNHSFMYNAGMFNMGSWAMFIPGWEAPNQNFFAEPLFFVGGLYVWWFITPVIFFCWILNKIKERKPHISLSTRLLILFGVMMVFDFVIESIFCRLEIFAYGGTVHSMTIWAGETYQYPLYNSFMMASFFMGMTVLRYFKDDKGQSFVERGIDKVNLPDAGKTLLRQLAIIAFLWLNLLITYYYPYNWFAMKADTFPSYPSYMRQGICGEGTQYACPSREIPVPSRKSLAYGPDDPALSPEVRNAQGIAQ